MRNRTKQNQTKQVFLITATFKGEWFIRKNALIKEWFLSHC